MMSDKYVPVCKGGGLYHTHKVEYSKETKEFVKGLLNESKLSILQRNVLNNIVKNGDPLPNLNKLKESIKIEKVKTAPTTTRKRTINTILQSGAYERDLYSPINNKVNRETEKKRLQCLMAYGKDLKIMPDDLNPDLVSKVSKTHKKAPKREITNNEIFEDLVLEVEERDQFLEDMKLLGEGKKYEDVIQGEIYSKLRQLELLDKERFKRETGAVAEYRNRLYKPG